MPAGQVLIMGCGYTGKRVASELVAKGYAVAATSRNPESLASLKVRALRLDVGDAESIEAIRPLMRRSTRVLISIPIVDSVLMDAIGRAERVVYLSTTGVYGAQRDVDEHTKPAPHSVREQSRIASERAVSRAVSPLVLRPAAIYGPHRGIHTSIAAGTYQLMGDGGNYVSRIHVDDLARHCVAALESQLTGAWPVADEEPCTSLEIARFCSEVLGLPLPSSAPAEALGETRRADRRVDGSAVRQALGITLKYPSYRVGIPACVAAESSPTRAF